MSQGFSYIVGSKAEGRQILTRLQSEFSTRPVLSSVHDVVFADTFEWLLFREGGCFCWSPVDRAIELHWTDLEGGPRYRARVKQPPCFATDLPVGPLRRDLLSIIDVRRLLPRAELRVRIREVCVVDRRGKTVARVELRHGTVRSPGAATRVRQLPISLRLRGLKGYESAANRLARFLERLPGLKAEKRPDLVVALDRISVRPADTPHRQQYPIRGEMRTDLAIKAILGALLDTLLRNVDGVRDQLDTEFLHDARVAVRRQRSALSQVRTVFDRRTTERLKRDLAWLGQLTGNARDLDVHLLEMRDYAEQLPDDKREGLEPLVDVLLLSRRAEQKKLVAGFGSVRFRRYVEFLRALIERPVPVRTVLANACRPIHTVAAERLRKAHRRLIRRGSKIDDDSPAEQLHRLRIDAKKLRYLLEFFAGLHSGGDVKKLVRALKGLQDNLGKLNDLAIQQQTLQALLERTNDEPPERRQQARATVQYLLERLVTLEAEERGRFRDQFSAFSQRSVKQRCERLYGARSERKP